MIVKAKISFCGIVSMGRGEVADIAEGPVLKDLLSAGYVEEVKKPKEKEPEEKKPTKKKAVKSGENK